ncbi:MAG: glycosyl transferase family 28, partial [Proteobacteria bacterium]|nr:glycosyl transferase family 28 [Pseudomonadota bacterium]
AAGADRRWRLLAGGNLDDGAFAALCDAAPEGVVVERARDDFPALLANCAVSVSQGGYNTLVEALHARARMVIIPFSRGGQTEQSLRAGRFGALGLARCVGEDELSPPRLAAAIDAALAAPPPPRGAVNMDGAARSAGLIARWAEGADG